MEKIDIDKLKDL